MGLRGRGEFVSLTRFVRAVAPSHVAEEQSWIGMARIFGLLVASKKDGAPLAHL